MNYSKHILIIIALFIFSRIGIGQTLSNNSEVSILICAPGEDLYSTFGHAAIRINDPANRIDYVYNYGTFNFETPHFYLKFVRGQLDYMMSVSYYKYFINSYINEKRWVKEQVLDLNNEQKNEVFSFLQNNALPENKYYRYDFFYDNCATRVKDVIKEVLKDELILPKKITDDGQTFRDLIHIYLQGHDWERFGINLALGRPTDKVVSMEEATFLPDYLGLAFEKTTIKIDGLEKPLIKKTRMLYMPKENVKESKTTILPFVVFSIIALIVLVLTYFEFKNKKFFIILDKTLFFVAGLTGIVILTLWFGTEHTTVINNWNILWAMPLFFIAAFMLKEKNKDYLKKFFLAMSIIIFISIVVKLASFWLFDYTIIPFAIILMMRSFLIYRKR